MTTAISVAARKGAKAVICASTGNTSASAAAYATKAGMTCGVLVPEGKIAMGKLSQAIAHGATLLQVDGNFDDCLTLARKLAEAYPVELVNSVNPARIEGQKTAASRSSTPSATPPTSTACPSATPATSRPTGGATASTPPTRRSATGPARPRTCRVMWGFQAAGAAPIVLGHPVDHPETIATAIRIGNPASWEQAVAARDESGGRIDAVTDEQILDAHRYLSVAGGRLRRARLGGVASPGLLASHEAGLVPPGRAHRLHRHRPRPQGPAVGAAHRRRERGRADPGLRRRVHGRPGARPRGLTA